MTGYLIVKEIDAGGNAAPYHCDYVKHPTFHAATATRDPAQRTDREIGDGVEIVTGWQWTGAGRGNRLQASERKGKTHDVPGGSGADRRRAKGPLGQGTGWQSCEAGRFLRRCFGRLEFHQEAETESQRAGSRQDGRGGEEALGQGEKRQGVSLRTAAVWIAPLLLACLAGGCATESRPRHVADKKWYQGDMDTQERTFFLDTFFNGR